MEVGGVRISHLVPHTEAADTSVSQLHPEVAGTLQLSQVGVGGALQQTVLSLPRAVHKGNLCSNSTGTVSQSALQLQRNSALNVSSDPSGTISQSLSIDLLPLSDPRLKISVSVTSESVLPLNHGRPLRSTTRAGQYITATLKAQPLLLQCHL